MNTSIFEKIGSDNESDYDKINSSFISNCSSIEIITCESNNDEKNQKIQTKDQMEEKKTKLINSN